MFEAPLPDLMPQLFPIAGRDVRATFENDGGILLSAARQHMILSKPVKLLRVLRFNALAASFEHGIITGCARRRARSPQGA